ncbi:hypothetical protein GCM10009854_24760 [Saccharopolyspora halophila]|uniref:Uncharacterized protein n=1 Tax=Saccharopolyspora halophila TaxID=405551 RepID=A0ABP5T775_9PSEU
MAATLANVNPYRDTEYLELVRDLVPRTMGVVQGKGATVSGVVRPERDSTWVGVTPHNQLGWRYALRIPRFEPAPTAHDVVLVLRRAESVRNHNRPRFDALPVVGDLHGAPLLDAADLVDDPTLDMTIDTFRSLLISATGGPTPLPAEGRPRLAGFSWFDPDYIRIYTAAPDGDVVGIDVDPAATPEGLGQAMHHGANLPEHHGAPPADDPFADTVLAAAR